jgi:hypothetical protein
MERIIYLIAIGILAVSCTRTLERPAANEVIDATEISRDVFHTSEFIDSSYFIPLETSERCLIKLINKVVFTYEYIFILDRQGNNKVLVFNKTGQFMHTIGEVGNGPGEYLLLYDFCIDTTAQEVYLLCDRNIVNCYTYGGNFLKKSSLIGFDGAWKLERFEDYFYFMVDQLFSYNLVVTDTAMKIVSKFFPFEEVGENFVIPVQPLQKTPSGIQYTRYLDDCVYEIKGKSDVSAPYEMNFGKTKMNFQKIKNYTREECRAKSNESRGDLKYFVRNTNYIISFYYDKLSSAIAIYNRKSRSSANCYSKNFYDKYAGFDVLFTCTTDKDEFVAVVAPEDILQHLNSTGDVEVKQYLEKLAITEDNNPLLYIVRTK